MILQDLTGEIIDAAIRINKTLGPGLFESVYEEVMAYELKKQGMIVERQVAIPVRYKDFTMDVGFRADLIVEREVIVEINSVEAVKPVFKKQVITLSATDGLQNRITN
jgi:GxxExxY protein